MFTLPPGNLYPFSGQLLGRLEVKAEVIEPLAVACSPVLKDPNNWHNWELALTIANQARQSAYNGKITVLEPADLDTSGSLAFQGLAPGKSHTLFLPVKSLPAEGMMNLVFKVNLDNGAELKISRKVSFLAAVKAKQALQIDGVLAEADWQRAMPFVLNKAEQVKQITDWAGPSDLSGKGYLLWDENYLYLAVEATDNIHYQKGSGSDMWQGDSIQFAIDPARIKGPGSEGHHELGSALGQQGPLNWRWAGAYNLQAGPIKSMKNAVRREGNTTIYELAVPWEELLAKDKVVEPGMLLGFSLLINDNDGTGRRGWIEYMSGIGQGKDPGAYGDLILIETN